MGQLIYLGKLKAMASKISKKWTNKGQTYAKFRKKYWTGLGKTTVSHIRNNKCNNVLRC